MEDEYRLTTIDNPWDPFDEFDEWQKFDEFEKHYYTNNYLMRIADSLENSLNISEDEAYQMAIDEIVRLNVLGIYMKVARNDIKKLRNQKISS